jgi:hydrogenase/urease accessory protein HupE
MSKIKRHGFVAALGFVVAAVSGVVTNIATGKSSWAWWITLIVLVVLGTTLQIYTSRLPFQASQPSVTASGVASAAIGGSSHGRINTKATNARATTSDRMQVEGITAAGPGSAAMEGNAMSPIKTSVDSIDHKDL